MLKDDENIDIKRKRSEQVFILSYKNPCDENNIK